MPKWGLTKNQVRSEPWGVSQALMRPKKTITDPVHGDIYVNELERLIIDSRAMQRLRRVRQLGTTHLVYPGSTETRFAHSLGTLRVAQDFLDAVLDNRNGPRPVVDLLSEWDETPGADGISDFDREWAKVTVLTRLGALLHDVCHVPFGHTIEDDLRVLLPHDENPARWRQVWLLLPEELQRLLTNNVDLRGQLMPLIVSRDPETGKKYDIDQLTYPFVSDIVGNTICADLIDYLKRNHLYAGLPIGVGHRFMNEFHVSESRLKDNAKRMVIRIKRDGRLRPDIVTELLKFLRFRYELSERVIYHHAKLAADAMLDKLLEMWSDWLWIDRARTYERELVETYGRRDISRLKEELSHRDPPPSDPYVPRKPEGPEEPPTKLAEVIDYEVREELERQFLRRSDDGLLEYLRDWGEEGSEDDKRRVAIGRLASAVLDRQLYKLIGQANTPFDKANSEKKYRQFGRPDARRHLEEGAADTVPLDHHWYVVTWVPDPDMRLKEADVLVEEDGKPLPLHKSETPGVEAIYKSHEMLWSINVYAHPSVVVSEDPDRPEDWPPASDKLLAYLGEEMGLDMKRRDGSSVGTLADLAVEKLVREEDLRPHLAKQLDRAVASHIRDSDLRRVRAFDAIYERIRSIAIDEGIIPPD